MDTGSRDNNDGGVTPSPVSPPSTTAASQGAPVESSKPEASTGAPAPKPVKLKPTQIAFLSGIANGLTKTGAAKAAKITRQTHWNWITAVDANGDPTPEAALYKEKFEEAYAAGTETLVDEARRRAVDGWDEPRFDKNGYEIGAVRKYDSDLLKFLIMQRDASFRQRHEIVGAGGAPLNPSKVEHTHTHKVDLSLLDDNELAEYRARVEAQRDLAAKLEARRGLGARPN